MFELKPDFEKTKERFDAFWEGEITDRAPVSLSVSVENPHILPPKKHERFEDRWLDIDYRVELEVTELYNRKYLGDSLPIVFPNMGPEIFSAWCGCGYNFGEYTTWSEPCIVSWEEDGDRAVLDMGHPLFKKTEEFTKKLLDRGRGEFITGLTDFHPGGDHIAALRDPQNLAIDLIENVDYVKEKLKTSEIDFFKAYKYFYDILRAGNMPITTWTSIIYDGLFYIPSNDFSYMISKEMFDEIFLPGIINECRFYEKSIYHLDGSGALRHLDSLLDIKELDGIQWVSGAGNEGFHKQIPIYKKIQAQGKLIQLWLKLEELPLLFENLKPEGIWISQVNGVRDEYTAKEVLKRVEKWV